MTDFAENATGRVKLNYRVQSKDHAMYLRVPRFSVLADYVAMGEKLAAMINTLNTRRYTDWAVLGWEYQLEDSEIWLPLGGMSPALIDEGEASTTGRGVGQAAAQIRFVGRGAVGSPWSITVFGTDYLPAGVGAPVDFRVTTSEDAAIGAFVTAITEVSPGAIAIDGSLVVAKLYANVKFNDAVVKTIRGA